MDSGCLPVISAPPAVLQPAFQSALLGREVPGVLHAFQPQPDAVVPAEMHRGVERKVPAAPVECRNIEVSRSVLLVDIDAVVPSVDAEYPSADTQGEMLRPPSRLCVPEPAEILAPQGVESSRGRPSAPLRFQVGAQVVAQRKLLGRTQPPAPAQLRGEQQFPEAKLRPELHERLVLRLPLVGPVCRVGGAYEAESLPACRDAAVFLVDGVVPPRLEGELPAIFRNPDQPACASEPAGIVRT